MDLSPSRRACARFVTGVGHLEDAAPFRLRVSLKLCATKAALILTAAALRSHRLMEWRCGMTGRWSGLLGIPVLAGLWMTPAMAMPSSVAVSAGSFFAAATQCEARKLISAGQSEALRQALGRYLSKSDQTHMQSGYARGLQESTVYVVQQKRWSAFVPDETSCTRVQSVLDDYKAQLDTE
jgi:hypothetical protein